MRGLLFFLLLLTSLLPVTVLAQQPEEEKVIQTLVAMWQAVEKGDLERYAGFLHPSYTAFGEGDAYLLEGRDQELRSMRRYLERASGVHTEMHQPVVKIEGNVAWIVYYWSDEGWIEGKRVTSSGKSTRIFLKEGDRWLCIHGHFTSVGD